MAFDAEKIVLRWRRGFQLRDQALVETIFAFRPETNPDAQRDNNNVYSYYFLTNRGYAGEPRFVDVNDGEPAWDTTTYPDGEYVILVTATDWNGNAGSAQERVIVRNRR